ncbi:uncharacterized protein LOC111459627 [Cucurbita moschata]|uniref:Uncharacterized protein LOC111459627 n=1 Tax=Cucurbita moschata TaxID=3662 RepID=A0A6J1H1Y5_CUCMO|nr:uncharacterized protein LOC111459627 [Cucurbita moschata]
MSRIMSWVDAARCAVIGAEQPQQQQQQRVISKQFDHFQMPLHYPKYKRSDYEGMAEWKLDCLLKEYGLPVAGDVAQKRKFAMGAFLWPSEMY